MRVALVTSLLLGTILAGCLTAEPTTDDEPVADVARAEAILDGNQVTMRVPVPVILIGFDESAADALRSQLSVLTLGRSGAGMVPIAEYSVHTPGAEWTTAWGGFLSTATHAGNGDLTGFSGDILDGNAIEEYLAENLDAIHDAPDGINRLVILDTGLRGHAYHYAGDVGWREPVRLIGERYGFLVWDPHAAADPWVGEGFAHHSPVPSASAEHMADWVHRATAIRALQMPIWPPTTLTCHAVTFILAVRGSTVTPAALGLQSWDEVFDLPRLETTFENLTQDEVHLDLRVLQLPADDPPLEAATRENNARVITQTYLDANFDQYHVPHDGCEPYLSLVVYGDLADQRTSSNGNAAMSINGKRISTSLVAENVRVMTEVVGYNDVWDESTNFERVGPGANPHEWFNWVVSHETGHLFSLPHPNYSTGTVAYSDPGFASTWNVMGYQMRRIVTEMSSVDTNNFARNQATFALLEAGTPSDEARAAYEEFRWKDAVRLLTE